MLFARCLRNAVGAGAIVLGSVFLAGCPIGTRTPLFDAESGVMPLAAGAYEAWHYSNDEKRWKREDGFYLDARATYYIAGKASADGRAMVPSKDPKDRGKVSFHKLSDGNTVLQMDSVTSEGPIVYYAGVRFEGDYMNIYILDCHEIKERSLGDLLSREVMNEDGVCPNPNRESIRAIAKVALDNLGPDSRIRPLKAK